MTVNTEGVTASGPAELTTMLMSIEQVPRYQSDWGYVVLDRSSGEVLASQTPQQLSDAGSTMKTFAVAAALAEYGSGYVFRGCSTKR